MKALKTTTFACNDLHKTTISLEAGYDPDLKKGLDKKHVARMVELKLLDVDAKGKPLKDKPKKKQANENKADEGVDESKVSPG